MPFGSSDHGQVNEISKVPSSPYVTASHSGPDPDNDLGLPDKIPQTWAGRHVFLGNEDAVNNLTMGTTLTLHPVRASCVTG